jgi:hypothetical protein
MMFKQWSTRTKIMRVLRADLEERANQALSLMEGALHNTLAPDFLPQDRDSLSVLLDELTHKRVPFLGFNGQVVRAGLLLSVLRALNCDVFVETGTYRGETSLLVAAQTTIPVFSCELNEATHRLAVKLLMPFRSRIRLTLGDSRQFLQSFLTNSKFHRPFFYLDAHWNSDIPLLGELDMIFSQLQDFVIVIDDFKVPFDSQFKYDVYGTVEFEEAYIAPALQRHADRLCVLYPCYSSSMETGARRGFCMITPYFLRDDIIIATDGNLKCAPIIAVTVRRQNL